MPSTRDLIDQARAREAALSQVAALMADARGDVTLLIEQLSGQPAPARSPDDAPGMTVEEFQRLRSQRLARRPSARSSAEDDAYFDNASPWSD